MSVMEDLLDLLAPIKEAGKLLQGRDWVSVSLYRVAVDQVYSILLDNIDRSRRPLTKFPESHTVPASTPYEWPT